MLIKHNCRISIDTYKLAKYCVLLYIGKTQTDSV